MKTLARAASLTHAPSHSAASLPPSLCAAGSVAAPRISPVPPQHGLHRPHTMPHRGRNGRWQAGAAQPSARTAAARRAISGRSGWWSSARHVPASSSHPSTEEFRPLLTAAIDCCYGACRRHRHRQEEHPSVVFPWTRMQVCLDIGSEVPLLFLLALSLCPLLSLTLLFGKDRKSVV